MKMLGNIGRVIYGLPFIVFGSFHFMQNEMMSEYVLGGWPLASFLVYLTGAALILAGISVIFRVLVRPAMLLLGILMFVFVLAVHLPAIVMAADQQAAQLNLTALLKDLSLGGAAWYIAGTYSVLD